MSTPQNIRYEVAADTDQGKVRQKNQDGVFQWASGSRPRALLALADGMGGHQAGEEASRIALEQVQETILPSLKKDKSVEDFSEHLLKAIKHANKAILDYAVEHGIETEDMGTTIEVVVLDGATAWIAHVGDSRVYLLGKQGLDQVTTDHTAVAEMIQAGMLEPEAVYDHPQRNILTQALGGEHIIEVDISHIEVSVGERILICSDGLWGLLRDNALERMLLQASPPNDLVTELIRAANEAGGEDNISVVICDILPG